MCCVCLNKALVQRTGLHKSHHELSLYSSENMRVAPLALGRSPTKKGDTDNAANYRPISLLSCVYRVYVIMIRQRMQTCVENSVCVLPNMVSDLRDPPRMLCI